MARGKRRLKKQSSAYRRISMIVAPVATLAVVVLGVAVVRTDVVGTDLTHAATASVGATEIGERAFRSSRDLTREALTQAPAHPEVKATGAMWTTENLSLRARPAEDARTFGEVDAFSRVKITGVSKAGYAQVVVARNTARWVTEKYLTDEKPVSPDGLPIVNKPCAGTSGVERGLTSAAIRVYRAVCNNFPQITRYGGRAGRGEHGSGRALDIMTSDTVLGTRIADFLKANARTFGLYDVIWQQRIFTQERAGEGWRRMSNRGSATANHMDHVHVKVL